MAISKTLARKLLMLTKSFVSMLSVISLRLKTSVAQ